MSTNPFRRATKTQARLRMALIGPAGSGKTYSALAIASGLGKRVALIDTERGSASKYAGSFEFDVLELDRFDADSYIKAIAAADAAAYEVLIIDSLTHAWAGKGGILEFVDGIRGRDEKAGFSAWGKATPRHNSIVDAVLGSACHVIGTMRSKMKYVQDKDERGKTRITKVGLEPVQREGLEYEFDIVGEMDDATLRIGKSRYTELTGLVIERPGAELGVQIAGWLSDGSELPSEHTEPAGYDWESPLRNALEEAGLDVGILASVLGQPVTYARIDDWFGEHPKASPLDLVKQAADLVAAP